MDKLVLGLLADILYIKGIICYEEFEAINDIKSPTDVDDFIEKMLRGEFNVYRKGESYIEYLARN